MKATRPTKNPEHAVKRLIYVPIVHDPWSEFDEASREATFGPNPDEKLVRQFREGQKEYWDGIDEALSNLEVDRVYQDGCFDWFSLEFHLDYYRKEADKSRNFRAICSLLDRGAQLMITESSDAKLEGYSEKDPVKRNAARDRFVAANIDATLQEGETGVLFMGINHRVHEILKENYSHIAVQRLNGNPRYLLEIIERLERDYRQTQT